MTRTLSQNAACLPYLLAGLTLPLKRRFLSACAKLITADHEVTLEEAEIFRAIADILGCPVPPLLPGQTLIGE